MKAARNVSVLVKPTAGPDAATSKAIDDVRKAIPVPGLLAGAQLLEDVALVTGSFTRVKHGLGRRPIGYAVARTKSAPSAAWVLYDDNDNKTDAAQWLYLRTVGAAVTIDLVVF